MLNVLFYESNHDLLNKLATTELNRVICPSPTLADNLRHLAPEYDIITISKWTSDHLKTLGLQKIRKSELMIKLAGFWRTQFPEEKSGFFHDAFEQFTELRSFTLELGLLAEFFNELDPKVVKSILIFWTYLEQEGLIDEHLAYKKLIESKYHKSFSLVGFKHMSGIQLDMLKELGEKVDVNVFLPVGIYDSAHSSDWINWLPVEDKKSLNIEKKDLKVIYTQEGKGNVAIHSFYENFENYDIIFTGNNLGINEYQELNRKNSFFKTTEDIFANQQSILHTFLENELKFGPLSREHFQNVIEKHKKDAVETANFRMYKMTEIYTEALGLYCEFHEMIDKFGLEVISMVSLLNMPRVSLVTIEKDIKRHIGDLGSIQFRDDSKSTALYATENTSAFKVNDKILTEAMTKALRSVGPIKRAGLEFAFQKLDLLNILSHEDAILLIEKKLLDMDISWREILKHFNLHELDLMFDYKVKKTKEILKPLIKKQKIKFNTNSATRIQAYIDCPRSFYFKFVDRIENEPVEKLNLTSSDLGQIEHKVIQRYFEYDISILKEKILYDRHETIAREEFQNYLVDKAIELNTTQFQSHYHEVLHYSLNGILFLSEFIKDKSIKGIYLEIPIKDNPWKLTGSIDCVVEEDSGLVHVFDFKRSKGASGTETETKNYSKIQIWIYILALTQEGKKIGSYGYLNLSSSDESVILNKHGSIIPDGIINEAKDAIEGAITTMTNDEAFDDVPRNNNVCTFCKVQLFCLKGGQCE